MPSVTVLGSCAAYPEPGSACSGFLVRWHGLQIAMDLGYATLSRLLALTPQGVDAVIITHAHPDHYLDLHGLLRFVHYGERARIPLYCPPDVLSALRLIEPDVDPLGAFVHYPLPGRWRIGPLEVTGVPLPHHVLNCGVRLDDGVSSLAYTGDTGPAPAIVELGRAADLFIIDSTDRPGELAKSPRYLLTAREAGEYAALAEARRVLLTHFWPGTDRQQSRRRAAEVFSGEVWCAVDGFDYFF